MTFGKVTDKSWVGSPIRSLDSYNYAAQLGANLANEVAFYFFDGDDQNMRVRFNLDSIRLVDPYLQYSFTFSGMVEEFSTWVGFSATDRNGGRGSGYGRYNIYNWKLETFGLSNQSSSVKDCGQQSNVSSLIPSWTDPRPRHSSMLESVFERALVFMLLLAAMVLWFMLLFIKRYQENFELSDDGLSCSSCNQGLDLRLPGNPDRRYKYCKQLNDATGRFCEKDRLGQDGFERAYEAVRGVGDSMVVAVKRVDNQSKQNMREFISEVAIIFQLMHRNLVQSVGWNNDNGRCLLIYEFMPNGSLDKALSGIPKPVDEKRASNGLEHVPSRHRTINIICSTGVDKASHYFHDELQQEVIIKDEKSNKIMLDNPINTRSGDFGLVRPVNYKQSSVSFCRLVKIPSILVLLFISAVLNLPANLVGANFTLPKHISCEDSLLCSGSAGSAEQNQIWLTFNPSIQSSLTGMALYNNPIRMVDGSKSTSFKSTFTFEIHPKLLNVVNRTQYVAGGDGMAFVMVANKSWTGSPGRSLGIYNQSAQEGTKTLAVEFDTMQNEELGDINGNHVGIDFQSAKSEVSRSADFLGGALYYGESIYTWVDYDGMSGRMEVRINRNSTRPIDALLDYYFDLSQVVAEFMWVGFTSSNSELKNGYGTAVIYNWTFESFGLASDEAPSPLLPEPESASLAPPLSGPAPSPKTWVMVSVVGGTICACLMVIGFCTMLCVSWRNKRDDQINYPDLGKSKALTYLGLMAKQEGGFNYKQLSQATGGFCEKAKVGQGGFGSVYRGILRGLGDDTLIAVKKVENESKQGEREFMAEVSIINQLRHRNVVQLLGWCVESGKYLLVYEFMPNGSLDKALFGHNQNPYRKYYGSRDIILTWPQRMNIVIGIARALHYLHNEWRQKVIHRDIKSSNIMLDSEFNAMLGDFGLARLVDRRKCPDTTLVAGTYGYIAPEIVVTRKYTEQTDTYAFGTVVLEIACGKRAYDVTLELEPVILVDWVWERLSQDRLMTVVDSRLEEKFDEQQMEMVLLMGLLCSHPDPTQRPSMRQVLQVLAGELPLPDVPISKPAPVYVSNVPHTRGYRKQKNNAHD